MSRKYTNNSNGKKLTAEKEINITYIQPGKPSPPPTPPSKIAPGKIYFEITIE